MINVFLKLCLQSQHRLDRNQYRYVKFPFGLHENDENFRSELAEHVVSIYQKIDYRDESLSEFFSGDFKSYTVENFTIIPHLILREFRDTIRKAGLCVPKRLYVKIPEIFHQVVQNDIPWPRQTVKTHPRSLQAIK